MKTPRFSGWLAWGMFGLVLLAFVGTTALDIAGCPNIYDPAESTPTGIVYGNTLLSALLRTLSELGFPVLGILIIRYRPKNRIGWLALIYGLVSVMNTFLLNYVHCAVAGDLDLPGSQEIVWLIIYLTSLLILITLGLFLLTFPNGQFLSKRWQQISLILVGLMLIYFIVTFFSFFTPAEDVDGLTSLVTPLFIFLLAGIVSLFIRWRRAKGDERQQIKWVAFFLATVGTLFITIEAVGTLWVPVIFESWFYLLEVNLFILGLPVVFGLAILNTDFMIWTSSFGARWFTVW